MSVKLPNRKVPGDFQRFHNNGQYAGAFELVDRAGRYLKATRSHQIDTSHDTSSYTCDTRCTHEPLEPCTSMCLKIRFSRAHPDFSRNFQKNGCRAYSDDPAARLSALKFTLGKPRARPVMSVTSRFVRTDNRPYGKLVREPPNRHNRAYTPLRPSRVTESAQTGNR